MIDLKQFCSPDHRALMRPWSEGEFSYACDSRIIVRIPRSPDIPERPDAPKNTYQELFAKQFPPEGFSEWVTCPTYDEPEPVACEVCHGRGQHHCPECEGYHECKRCRGSGQRSTAQWPKVIVGRLHVAQHYLAMICVLPGHVEIDPTFNAPGTPMPFRFGGGCGLISTSNPKEDSE